MESRAERYRSERDDARIDLAQKTHESSEIKRRLEQVERFLEQSGMDVGEITTALQERRGSVQTLNRMSLELEERDTENARLEEKLRKKSQQMQSPLGMMSMAVSSLVGVQCTRITLIQIMMELIRCYKVLEDASDENNDDRSRSDIEVTDRVASGDNSVVAMLRSQLDESNALNAQLENKVKAQHQKLSSLAKTMTELRAVQSALDSKVVSGEDLKLEELQSRLKRAVDEKREIKMRLERRDQEFTEMEWELNDSNKRLFDAQATIETHSFAMESLQKALEVSKQENENIVLQKQNADNEYNNLKQRHKELRKASKRLLAEHNRTSSPSIP